MGASDKNQNDCAIVLWWNLDYIVKWCEVADYE